MKKKTFIVVLLVLVLFSLNFAVAHEIDNSTNDDLVSQTEEQIYEVSDVNETVLEASQIPTQINVESQTTFDAIGEYFKIKLSDNQGNAIVNTPVTFNVAGLSYNRNTDNGGIASLQLILDDGYHQITTNFAGNSNYGPSSLTTVITMSNTRVVDAGLSNSEIQKIIDNAKVNNVILFNGVSYSDINLMITKSLTLKSNVNTILNSISGPAITIKGKSASLTSIKGFNVQGEDDGIVISDCDFVTIANNHISGSGNGIVAIGTKYLNITQNNIVKNAKSGIVIANSMYSYIFDNIISKNGNNGIDVAKSSYVYIHGNTISDNGKNGVNLDKSVNGAKYGSGPDNVYINKNAIQNNKEDGILVKNAGNNININSNSVISNKGNGISLAQIGDNVIQSNVITDNWVNGIKFFDNYVKPKNQDISYNAIYFNIRMDVEAKETYYQETGSRLEIGDNWYTDHAGICPKIRTNNINFIVRQVGSNEFQALFLDSNGNIASLLPDRTLTYTTNNGKSLTITVSGGTAVFTVDAKDGDLVKSNVDGSRRENVYDSTTKKIQASNGKSPSYTYPSIPNYKIYEDINGGNGGSGGSANGDGSGGSSNSGNGRIEHGSRSNNGNSTHSQKNDPSNNVNNPVNDATQSYDSDVATSQASASDAGSGDSTGGEAQSQSVVKQIILEEDEFFRVTGITLIVLLMILTIGFYYRDDIKEMNSKR